MVGDADRQLAIVKRVIYGICHLVVFAHIKRSNALYLKIDYSLSSTQVRWCFVKNNFRFQALLSKRKKGDKGFEKIEKKSRFQFKSLVYNDVLVCHFYRLL